MEGKVIVHLYLATGIKYIYDQLIIVYDPIWNFLNTGSATVTICSIT